MIPPTMLPRWLIRRAGRNPKPPDASEERRVQLLLYGRITQIRVLPKGGR